LNEQYLMSELETGQIAKIISLSSKGPLRRRFFDIGLVPGTEVSCVGVSPLGDPKAYLVRGMVVAVRSDDAKGIVVEYN